MASGSKEKLVIVGDGEIAEMAYEYFRESNDYEIVAFSAEQKFMKNQTLYGLPVVPLEKLETFFDPKNHKAFVAISFTQLNRVRTKLVNIVKEKGYSLCSYVSPKSFIGTNVEIGENCFILENVTIQRAVKIGDNVTIGPGSTIGHKSVIHNNCFLAMQVAISGYCDIGENCFFGVNSCTVGAIKLGGDSIFGAGAVVIRDTQEKQVYVGNPAKPLPNKNIESYIAGEAI